MMNMNIPENSLCDYAGSFLVWPAVVNVNGALEFSTNNQTKNFTV